MGSEPRAMRCGAWRSLGDLRGAEARESSSGRVVLVTGAAGFIGYHCALALNKHGDRVIGVDNCCPGYSSIRSQRFENLHDEGIYVFEADTGDGSSLNRILRQYKVTHTLSIASDAGVVGLRLLPVHAPQGPECADWGPLSLPQDFEKRVASDTFDGLGGIELERDFTYIDDVVAGTLTAPCASAPSLKDVAGFEKHDIGMKDPVTIPHLVDCLEKSFGQEAAHGHAPKLPRGGVFETPLTDSTARADTGRSSIPPLAIGVDSFVDWYKDYFKERAAEATVAECIIIASQ